MEVVILAAGKGTRMRSRLPKVLQPLAGRPLLAHVLDTARALNPQRTVVVIGHEAQQVRAAFAAQGDLGGQAALQVIDQGIKAIYATPPFTSFSDPL